MRLLLDTHVAIWSVNMPHRIPESICASITSDENSVWVSAAAVWEIAIKRRLGRHDAPPFSSHQAIAEFENAGFRFLDVTPAHTAFVEQLPLHHADPFDRLMLAQAMLEELQFVTYDRHLSRYDIAMLTWS